MMTTTNQPTTPNGRTRLKYDANGALVEQSLDPSTFQNRGVIDVPIRPQKPEPKTAAELQAELERTQSDLDSALAHFTQWQHKDEFGAEKRELKIYLAEHEQRVKEAREKLNELESADSPHTKLLKNVARIEMQVSHLAREAQFSAANRVAAEQYDQPLKNLTLEHQREIMRRQTISAIQHIASNAFHGFGRLELQQRTLDGAKLCAD